MDKLTGHGRPHAHLVGEVGQHYEDLDTGDIYECRIASQYSPTHGWPVGGYVWELRAKGEDIQDGLMGGSTSWNDLADKPFSTRMETQRVQTYELKFSSILLSDGRMSQTISGQDLAGISGSDIAVFTYESPTIAVYQCVAKRVNSVNDKFVSEEDGVTITSLRVQFDDYLVVEGLPDKIMGESSNSIKVTFYTEESVEVIEKIDSKFLPKAEAIADVTAAPTAEEFNALLASLRAAGYLAT